MHEAEPHPPSITTQINGELVTGKADAATDPAVVYLTSLAGAHSRRTMRAALDRIAQIVLAKDDATCWELPWAALRFQHTQAIRTALIEDVSPRTGKPYAPATINKMLAALRGVLRAAWMLEQMSAEEYHRAAAVENVSGNSLPAGRNLQRGELRALLETCEADDLGVRDAALLSLLYACGLRRAEVVALQLADVDAERLVVRGKRRKVRTVPIGAAAPALEQWLVLRGRQAGPLFHGLGNRNQGKKLTTQAVYDMLQRRAKAAGIDHVSPHDFRRSFVGDLLDAGADISTVQKMAGHAHVNTTTRYDRRGERAKQRAAGLLHVPVQQRVPPPAAPLPAERSEAAED